MLAATYTAGKGFAVRDVPEPVIGPDDLRLRVTAAAICATDLKIVRHGHRKLSDGRSIVLGHEFAGVVEEVGADVKNFAPGVRAGVVPNAGCGSCAACRRRQANYCPDYTAFGIDRDGGHAPRVRIPAQFLAQGNLIALPDDLPDEQACLLEPLSCAVNGVRQARVEAGDSVLVYGAGPMGRLIVMMCRVTGASKVLVVEPLARRRRLALDAGADEAFDPGAGDVASWARARTGGEGPDVIILACPAPELPPQALDLLAPSGRLCLFAGLAQGTPHVPLDTNAIHYRNLTVTGTTGGSADDYRHALHLAADGRVDLGRVIAGRFALSDLEEAYAAASAGADGKVVLLA